MNAPPTAKPCAQRQGAELTPGQQVVGEDDLFARLGLRRLARRLLVEDRGRECRRCRMFVGHR